MFGIIRCPSCGEIQGCEIRYKTTTCSRCDRRISLSLAISYGTYKDQKDMRKALWDLKAAEMDGSEFNLKDEMISVSDERTKPILNKQGKEQLLLSIIDEGSVDLESIVKACNRYDIFKREVQEIINILQNKNLVYSPKYNVFKKV